MKRFMFMHCGFVKPSPEDMQAWRQWFASIADKQVDQAGFAGGREISSSGTKDLPWGPDSITGFNIIEAESLDDAEQLAKSCPFVASVRVYELRA